jgi:hypothetical protein
MATAEFPRDADVEAERKYLAELLAWNTSAPMTGQRGQLLWWRDGRLRMGSPVGTERQHKESPQMPGSAG